jgi:hypothetical protein
VEKDLQMIKDLGLDPQWGHPKPEAATSVTEIEQPELAPVAGTA